jgi:hypothetical protein
MCAKSIIVIGSIVCSAVALQPSLASAQSSFFTLTKVADFDTVLPGSAGMFGGSEGAPPALEAGRVAFWAYGDDADGVYMATIGSNLIRVADTTTTIPGTAMPFEAFDYVSLDGQRVVFLGYGTGDEDDIEGIFRFDSGAISRIADLNSPVPGRTGGFLEFGTSSADDGQVAFIGEDFEDVEEGVYLGDGGHLKRVADTTTVVPGQAGHFEFFNAVVADNTKLALIADSASATGVYLHDRVTGSLTRVADSGTQAPGRAENFVDFGDGFGGLDLDDGSIGFIGHFGVGRSGGSGVYVVDANSGEITRIADTTSTVPDDEGFFRDAFTAVSLDGGLVALGYGLEGNSRPFPPIPQTPFFGVYTNLSGSLESLLRDGDVLDGKVVRRAYIGAEGLDGNQIAMSVVFVDGTEGIYVATLVPEPATLALLFTACGLLAIAVTRRNRFNCDCWRTLSN